MHMKRILKLIIGQSLVGTTVSSISLAFKIEDLLLIVVSVVALEVVESLISMYVGRLFKF